MDMNYIKNNVSPKLTNYKLTYSSYPSGDFGSLERVVVEGRNKMGGIDVWSKGWLDINIYDLTLDKEVMNILLEPSETQEQEIAIAKFLGILLSEK
ncbi:hypothetical protein GCM10023211_09360 [Orbus sasakiae]|uniref:Uncharacterized protein n=1 Tax=Orbus sasakiae TaxID=1078475 RepID=A0ABP9N2J0_9GAMM